MTALHIVLIVVSVVVLGVLAVVGFSLVRFKIMTGRAIPGAPTGGARLTADVPIPGEAPVPLTMDVYTPEGATGRPAILFVPGDGPQWLLRGAKDWRLFHSYGQLAASRGYVGVVVSHRSSRNYKDAAGMVSDVERALAALRDRADELGLDPGRIAVWTCSGSSGPVLARFLATRPTGVRALVSFYGFLDLTAFTLKVPPEVVAEYSLPAVLERLDQVPIPVYLLHAGRDRKMMTQGYERVVALVRERGLTLTSRVYAGGQHGFEVLQPADEVHDELARAFGFIDGAVGA